MRILMTAAAFCCVLVGGASAGELRLRGHASNLCLDVKGGLDQPNGTSIIVFPCNGGDNQSFTFMGDGTIRAGRRCVDISGGAARAGDRVIIYSCNGGANQQWRVGANGEIICFGRTICALMCPVSAGPERAWLPGRARAAVKTVPTSSGARAEAGKGGWPGRIGAASAALMAGFVPPRASAALLCGPSASTSNP